MANGEIKFKVGFDVNKAGLDNLRQTLSHLKSELGKQIDFSKSLKTDKANKELLEVQTTINNVQNALRNSFNADLGTLNVAKFNAALKDIGIQKIQTDFNKMGAAGQIAFKNLATQAMTTNMQLKQSHSMIDKMAETLGNTLKWNISSGAINRMTDAIQQAWGFTKSLDNSLNDIMIVTGKSADEMERFSRQANKAAKELSAGTTDYTKASLIYYQQGLSDEEVAARAETTLKVANVTGQNADTVSQNLTAVWNGYKVSAEEAELYIDKLSAVAATTAADLDGLSTGMSKVASAANLMGVDVDQLNATLATVISVTQQAPESVGTAFKTIYARMGDIEAGLDTETTLGEYTSKVKEIAGVNVLDTNNKLRDMGEVIEEIGGKWTTLSREQQIALSQAMAGTRQYNNLLALFDSWDMYTNALNESANAAGTLQEQQETYQQTVEASLQELRTTFEGLYMELFDTETIKDMVDMLTSVMEKIESFVKAIGGGGNALSALGAIATRVFSKQIAQGIATTITNFKIAQDNAAQVAAQFQTIELFGGRQNVAGGDAYLRKLTEMKKSVLDLGNLVTNEQHEQANSIIKTTNELQNQKIAYDESVKQAQEFLQSSSKKDNFKLYETDDEGKMKYNDDFITSKDYSRANEALIEIQQNAEKTGDVIEVAEIKLKRYNNEIGNSEKGTKAVKEANKDFNRSIRDISQNINKSSNIYAEYRNKIKDIQKAYIEAYKSGDQDKISTLGQKLLNTYTEVNQKIANEAEKTGKVLAQQSENTGQKIQKDIEDAETSWKKFINNLQTVKNIQSFVQILGGINQIASGLRSLWNIAEILNNEDLSFGEKALQVISALSMGLSMLFSGVMTLVTVIPPLLIQLKALTLEEYKAATAGQALAMSLKGLGTVGIKAIKKLGTAIGSFAKAHPAILAITVAVAALTAALSFHSKAVEKARENAINDAKATLEEVKAKQEESKKVEELTDNYSKLYQQYKETGKVSEEFKTAADDVIEALGVQDVAVLKLTGDYAELTKRILENKRIKLEADKEEAEKGVKSQEDIISNIIATKDNPEVIDRYSHSANFGESENAKFIEIDLGLSTSDELGFVSYLQDKGITYGQGHNEAYLQIDKNMSSGELYGLLLEIENQIKTEYEKEEYEDSEFYQYLQDIKNDDELKEAYEAWKEQSKLLKDAIAELELYNGDLIYSIPEIENQNQYEEKKVEVKEALRNTREFETEDELEKATTDLFSQYLTSEKVKNYEERIAFSEEISKKIIPQRTYSAAFSTSPDYVQSSYETNKESIENSKKDIKDKIADLSDEEFSVLTTVVDIDKLKSKEIFDAYIDYAKEYAKAQEIELKISTTEDLASSLKEGKELTEEQQNALKDLEAEYPELQAIQDKTSAEYISNLLKIQQQLEEQKIATEEAATDVLIQCALELDVDTDEFEETMKDIAEQQYKVVVAVKADVQSDFDNLVDNMIDIDSMASKIGDDFIVAASDLEELNDMFPGILENMKITEDGSVQLNSTITKEAIEASKAQIKADTAATVEKLLNQAKEMEAKRDAAKNVAKILRDSITNEEVADTAKAELDNALQILKSDNSASLAEQEQSDTKNVAETAAASATEMANNYGEAYKKMSEDAIEWAKTAQNAIKASADINVNIPELPVNFGGLNLSSSVVIKESDKADLQDAKEMDGLTDADKEEIAAYYDSVGESWDKLASNTFGKAMELMAREEESENKLNNIQSGKGADGEKNNTKEPEIIKYEEKEVDLYREVNLELAKQEKLLSKLQKEQDKLNGKELIDNLNEQLEVIEKQKQALIEKAAIARKEAQTHRDSLESQGVQFDEEGYITNYDEMLKYKEDYLKRVTEKYNSLTEAEQKNYKKHLDEAETDYENFKNSMDRYTDIISEELPSYIEEFEDKLDEEIEINISKFNYEVEISLDLSNAKRQWNEFTRDVFLDKDDTVGISNSYLKDMETYEKDAQDSSDQAIAVQKELEIINAGGYSKIYGNDAKKAEEDLLKYQEDTIAAMRGAKETAEQSRQLWLSGIDDSISELNESAEVYETLDSLYNHDMNMVNMLYGEDAYDRIDNIYAQKQTNDLEEIDNIKKRAEYYQQMMDAETDPEAKEKWKKAWLSTINELTSKTEEAVKTVLDKHANAVKKTIEEMNEKILPKDKNGITMDLDLIGEEWDLIRENGERYLDDIEVGFGIQDFQNSFEDAFDATDSIAGQNKLNKVYQEQLDILKEKDKLSQYDLDHAQAMLDIELKKIALEEARQNKSSMRLRRDAQGNYSYQYVEDEEATKDAKKDLQDAQKGLYQLDKEKYLEDVQYVYDKTKELEDKIIELYNDTTLTNEEREQKKALLIEQYAPQIEEATKKVEESKVNLGNSTKIVMGAIGDEIVKDFVGSEGVGTLPEMESGMAQFVENIGKEGGMKSILETTFNTLDGVLDDTEQSIKDIGEAAGENFETTGIDNIGENAKDSKGYVDKLKTSVSGLKTKVDELIKKEKAETEALKALSKQGDQRLDDLIGTESQIRKNTEAMQEYINKLKETRLEEAKKANEESKKKDPSDIPKKNPSSNAKKTPKPQKVPKVESNSGGGKSSDDDKKSSKNTSETSKTNTLIGRSVRFLGDYYYDTANDTPGVSARKIDRTKDTYANKVGYITAKIIDYKVSSSRRYQIEFDKRFTANSSAPNKGWVYKNDISQYKTGGLVDKTGPAWLDGTKSQPELVLNSKDTQNLLDTIKILRNADSLANSLNRSMSERMEARLNTELKRMSNMMDIIKIEREPSNDSLEQNVHIEADFPNVSDSNEIEQALMNLVNVASQYAYRR